MHLLKKMFWHFIHLLEHNEHSIPVTLFKKTIYPCARCLGMYIGMFLLFPTILILAYLDGFNLSGIAFISASERFGFADVFMVSLLLSMFSIVEWSIVRLKIWHGNNTLRFYNGILLGIGMLFFCSFLPLPLPINVLILSTFFLIFHMIRYAFLCKEHGLSLRNPLSHNIAIIGMTPIAGQIGCSQTGGICECCTCCPCGSCTACLCNPFCCCIGIIPILLIIKKSLDRGGQNTE